MTATLPISFYRQSVIEVAQKLLGKRLVTRREGIITSGLIVETEAYLHQNDSACHAARGPTRSNASMFGPAGCAYVYPIHAKYCFNVVAQAENEGCAVLIRAVKPLEGIEQMTVRRHTDRIKDLARGPARLCQAFSIDRNDDGLNLERKNQIWIDDVQSMPVDQPVIKKTTRIGVTSNKRRLLRFVVRGNEFVSGPKYLRE